MEGLVALQDAGLVRHVGLSNVSVEQLDAASKVGPVAAVQNSWSPGRTGSEPVLRRCEDLGVAFMAYSPLGGSFRAGGLAERHPAFAAVASARGVSPQRVALAWVLAQSPRMMAVVGASRPETILDSAGALDLELTADELKRLAE
jgi:aryl-alcohol dehydrogenase-like predicted oxidoreductase